MACKIIQKDGTTMILCGKFKPQQYCAHCGGPANLLCDWPLPNGKTCDLPICPRCSTPDGPDKDYCKAHTHCDGAQR